MPRAEDIAKIFGGFRRSGRGWMVRCPVHDDRTPSLSLADGENGRLLVKCFAGCDPRAILAEIRRKGITTSPLPVLSSPPPASSFDWSRKAEVIFNASRSLRATAAEAYLLGRGCALPETDEIRYLPPRSPNQYPVMLSRITDAVTGKPTSLHFTLIKRDGKGKAPVERQKRLLSGHRKAGGVVRLVDSSTILTDLGIAEGIETALSVLRLGWHPIWAALDAGNIAAFPVLDGVQKLTIFADNDPAGLEAAYKCAVRWKAAGRAVHIIAPKAQGADWND